MPFQRDELAKKIADRLNVVSNQLKTRTRASFTDANHSLEFVMARFFNALFGWNLTDLNAEKQNFPAADIGDRERRVAMQITNEDSSAKIATTRDKAVDHGLGKDFGRLIIFFLLPKKPGMPKKFVQPKGGPEIECWDLADLLKQMNNLPDVAALATAAKVLDEELGTAGEHPLTTSLHLLPPNPRDSGFVGREADLAKLRALNPSAGTHLTGLRGMGGIGKTALALVLAHEWAARFPDAQLFLDARGTQADPPSARALMERVVLAFHPTAKLPDDDTAIAAIYRDVLTGKRALILLDNARDAAQARPLIPPAGCALIVTSRHTFMLGTVKPHDVGRLPDDEAVALLREIAPDLTEAEAAALVPLCAGLPLALRIAASHIALDSVERGGPPDIVGYILALGSGPLAHLDADAADAGEVTISEALRLSETRLPEPEREAWRKLGVFTASFDARAAQAVAGADDAMLGHFVRRSLLEREGAERFKVHDLAADYACAQLGGEALTALHLAHARYYTEVGEEADRLYLKGDAVGGLALFDREHDQVEAAYKWLTESANEAAAWQLVLLVNAVVHTGQRLRFHPRERIAWLEKQRIAARAVRHFDAEGSALTNLGVACLDLGDARQAITYLEQRLAMISEGRNRNGEGATLANLGIAYRQLGDTGKSIQYFEQHLLIARKTGDRRSEGTSLGNLGNAYADLDNPRKAVHFHEQHLAIAREVRDPREEGNALGNLGNAYRASGNANKATEYYEHQLRITRKIGDKHGEGSALANLGNVCFSLGNAGKAIEYYEQALVIIRKSGDRRAAGLILGNLGAAFHTLGDTRNAITYYEQHLAIIREIGDIRAEGVNLGNLGLIHAALGDACKAIEFYERRIAIAREIGDRRGEGNSLWNSALAHDSLGNRPEAIARAAAALEIFEAIEDPNAAKVRAELAEWRAT